MWVRLTDVNNMFEHVKEVRKFETAKCLIKPWGRYGINITFDECNKWLLQLKKNNLTSHL